MSKDKLTKAEEERLLKWASKLTPEELGAVLLALDLALEGKIPLPMTATEVKQREEEWKKKEQKARDDLLQALADLTLQVLAARSNTKPDS